MVEFDGTITKCHKELHNILETLCGFQVRDNAEFGKYKIDCYCEEIKCGFEADGKLYHTWKKKDKKRDTEILENYGVRILRLPEELIKDRDKTACEIMCFVLSGVENG
jgi:very-short-patch-repair endonuclease